MWCKARVMARAWTWMMYVAPIGLGEYMSHPHHFASCIGSRAPRVLACQRWLAMHGPGMHGFCAGQMQGSGAVALSKARLSLSCYTPYYFSSLRRSDDPRVAPRRGIRQVGIEKSAGASPLRVESLLPNAPPRVNMYP